jgi:hypothetical protein
MTADDIKALVERLQKYCGTLAPPIARGLTHEAQRALTSLSTQVEALTLENQRLRVDAWQPIKTAPEDKLLVVGWLDKDDPDDPERHAFDFIEDGGWVRHNEDYDHYLCVAPPGSRGPSADAPYTHWLAVPKIDAELAQADKEKP